MTSTMPSPRPAKNTDGLKLIGLELAGPEPGWTPTSSCEMLRSIRRPNNGGMTSLEEKHRFRENVREGDTSSLQTLQHHDPAERKSLGMRGFRWSARMHLKKRRE